MKKMIFILLAFSIFSCQKEEVQPEALTTFSVQKDGKTWSGTTSFRLDPATDTLLIFGSSRNPEATFTMKIKFEGIGSYPLAGNQGKYLTTLGGDVRMSEYKIGDNPSGQLVITKYNPANRAVEGNFSFLVSKFYDYADTNAPTLNFTEGTYNGIIKVIK